MHYANFQMLIKTNIRATFYIFTFDFNNLAWLPTTRSDQYKSNTQNKQPSVTDESPLGSTLKHVDRWLIVSFKCAFALCTPPNTAYSLR